MYEKLIAACKNYNARSKDAVFISLLPKNVLADRPKQQQAAIKLILFIYESKLLTLDVYDSLYRDSLNAELYQELLSACHLLDDANNICEYYLKSILISPYPEELAKIIVILMEKDIEPDHFIAKQLSPSNESINTVYYLAALERLQALGWLKKAMIEQVCALSSPKLFTQQLSALVLSNHGMIYAPSWLYDLFVHTSSPEKLITSLIALRHLGSNLFNQFNCQILAFQLFEYKPLGILLNILSNLSISNQTADADFEPNYMSQNVFDLIVECTNYEWLVSATALEKIWPAISAEEIERALPALFILSIQPDSLIRAEQLISTGDLMQSVTAADDIIIKDHVARLNPSPLAKTGFFAKVTYDDFSDDDYLPAAKKAKLD